MQIIFGIVGFAIGAVGDIMVGGIAHKAIGLAKLTFAAYMLAVAGYVFTVLTGGGPVAGTSGFVSAATFLGYSVVVLSALGLSSAILSGDSD
ncbi:MAG: hypothetical protein VR70_10810 [Rhodospirillaceae bacterium BRH_c57]|nr:MAG: hypothetical protein VR70_10810 [Rhodospirillaceae bacterium BRH_c57]